MNSQSLRDSALWWLERVLLVMIGCIVGAMGATKSFDKVLSAKWYWASLNRPSERSPSNDIETTRKMFQMPVIMAIATFDNGKSEIRLSDRTKLKRWRDALNECSEFRGSLIGVTSSAPFKGGSGNSNIKLAQLRALTVESVFKFGRRLSVYPEASSDEEVLARRFVEDRQQGMIRPALAAINRRVDLKIENFGSCEPSDL